MRKHEPSFDRLPEFIAYRDTGCDAHSNCLTCPLPACRYDEPGGFQRAARGRRDSEVMRLRSVQALTVDEIASRCGVSSRTVHRILNRASTGAPARMAS